nr:dihydrolipoyl dehydrogenase [Candidatus Sigynarchaeota archaeon]
MITYDLCTIGSGVGLTVLSRAISAGWKCALVEPGKIGGTCLTRGCIPSKVLVHPADLIREAKHAKKIGLDFRLENSSIDWDMIASRMWSQIDESKEMEAGLKEVKNLDVYRGIGEFTGKYEMKVKLQGETYSEPFKAKRFVIASGTRSAIPPVKGIEETGYVTNETFFGEKFPKKPWGSLLILGGGIIAAEFAHIFSAMGTKVTIIEMLSRLVTTEEPEVSLLLEKNFRKYMTVLLGKKVIEAKKDDNKKSLILEDVQTKQQIQVDGEEILVAAGRKSNADLLKVDKTGVEVDQKGWIKANAYLETNVPNIWCIGDANGKFQFRHKANMEADACITNIFNPAHKEPVDYSATPWAIFTWPQIGHVGLTEKEAIDAGHEIYVATKHYSSVAAGFAYGYQPNDDDDGFVKLIVAKNRKILGTHIIGPDASILVQPIVYLMKAGYECAMPRPDGKLEHVSSMACPEAGSVRPLYQSQVIHPSLNEVVGWAIGALRPVNIKGHEHEHQHE